MQTSLHAFMPSSVSEAAGDAIAACVPGTVFCHSVDGTLALGAGVARDAKKKWGRPGRPGGAEDLEPGTALLQTTPAGATVAHLVCNRIYWVKEGPGTYLPALEAALRDAVAKLARSGVDKPAFVCPRIGCDLDRQAWPDVRAVLERVGRDTEARFTVYTPAS